jgi:putative PIN family toxin of toxin-antitoxin system
VRVVFDTNIFVSAFVIKGSIAEKEIIQILENKDTLLISKEIIGEVLSVLSSKFSRDREAISQVAVHLSELAEFIYPRKKLVFLRMILTIGYSNAPFMGVLMLL